MARRKTGKYDRLPTEPRLWAIDAHELAASIISLRQAAIDYDSAVKSDGTENRGDANQRFGNLQCHVVGLKRDLFRKGIDLQDVPGRLTVKERGILVFKMRRWRPRKVFQAIHEISGIITLLPAVTDVLHHADAVASADVYEDDHLPEIPEKMLERLQRAEVLANRVIDKLERVVFIEPTVEETHFNTLKPLDGTDTKPDTQKKSQNILPEDSQSRKYINAIIQNKRLPDADRRNETDIRREIAPDDEKKQEAIRKASERYFQ